MSILLNLPPLVSMIILSAVAITISNILLRKVRKRMPHDVLKENHEVAGFIFNAFGLIYGVLVAFVVFVSWTDYSGSKKNVEREVNLIMDLYSYSYGLPDTLQMSVKNTLKEYTRLVAEEEWKLMGEGKISNETKEQFGKLWKLYFTVDEKMLPNQTAYNHSLDQLNELGECRRIRIFNSRDLIPPVIWFVLIFSAVCLVSFTFFFGVRNVKAQSVMTSVLTLINTFLLYIIFVLDHPFRGYSKISNAAFIAVWQLMQQLN
jgi:hypothetical protein